MVAVAVVVCLLGSSQAQDRRKIAVVADTKVPPIYQEAEKSIVDGLLAKLAENPSVQPIDRSQLDVLRQEMGNKYDAYFDYADVSQIGKLKGVSALIVVTVTSYEGDAMQKVTPIFVGNKITITGTAHLSVSVKALAVETGVVLSAPNAIKDRNAVFKSYTSFGNEPAVRGDPKTMFNAESAKLKSDICNDAVEEIYPKLSSALAAAPMPSQTVAVVVPPGMVAGMLEGKVLVNRGSSNGYKTGQTYQVFRMTDTGIVDPQTKVSIKRKRSICVLTLSDVDDTSSTGLCPGGTPVAGDQLQAVAK